MTWYTTIALLVSAGWLLIGAVSFRRGVYRTWWSALMIVSVAMVCWNVGYFLQQNVPDSSVATATSLMIEASGLMAIAGVLHFAAALTRVPTGWRAVAACIGYLLAVALFLAGHIPPIRTIRFFAGSDWDMVVLAYGMIVCAATFAIEIVELVQASDPVERHRIKYVIMATAGASAGYAHDFYVTGGLPTWSFGNVTAVFCGAVGVHAMTGDTIVPISTVFRDIRHALAAVVLIVLSYVALLTVGRDTAVMWLVAVPVAVVVTLYLLFLVRHRVFELGERILFSERYHFRRKLNLFESRIATIGSSRELVSKLLELLTEHLGIQHALLIASEEIEPLFAGIEEQSSSGTVTGEHVYALREVHLLKILSRLNGPLRRSDLARESLESEIGISFDRSAMDRTMQRMHCELVLPLFAGDRLLGALGLGEKASGDVYSKEDVRALLELAAHIGLYLENARIRHRAQQADRMTSLREMADRIVQMLRERVEKLRDAVEPMQPDGSLDAATLDRFRNELAHVHDVVDALRRFARPPSVSRGKCDVARVIRQVLDGYHWERWFEHVTIDTEVEEELPAAFADHKQLARALELLLLNACEAVDNHSGTVTISAAANADAPRPHTRIDITDSGPGIDPENALRIFEPLYTTRPGHFGVGLSVAYALLRQNECSISISNNPESGGATVTVRCPMWASPVEPKS